MHIDKPKGSTQKEQKVGKQRFVPHLNQKGWENPISANAVKRFSLKGVKLVPKCFVKQRRSLKGTFRAGMYILNEVADRNKGINRVVRAVVS